MALTQPGFFARLFRTAPARAYKDAVIANAEAQRQAARDVSAIKLLLKGELEPRCERARNSLHIALRTAQSRQREWDDSTELLRRARMRFPTIIAPATLERCKLAACGMNRRWRACARACSPRPWPCMKPGWRKWRRRAGPALAATCWPYRNC